MTLRLAVFACAILLLLGSGEIATASRSMCSWSMSRQPVRSDTTGYFLARATGDSVIVGDFYWGRAFGQVAVVTRVSTLPSSGRRVGEKVVLIWWALDASCGRIAPPRPVRVKPGSELFIGLPSRSRAAFLNGTATYDVDDRQVGNNFVWVPALEDPVLRYHGEARVRVELMKASEYFEMYENYLPASQARVPRRADEHFVQWSNRHPASSRKYPACAVLSWAKKHLDLGPSRMPEDCARRTSGPGY